MTRKSYPPIADPGPRVACPCCKRELFAVDLPWTQYGSDDAPFELVPVPRTMQPCCAFVSVFDEHIPTTGPYGRNACAPFQRGYRPGGACSWLGLDCNVASHVTPVTPAVFSYNASAAQQDADERCFDVARNVHKNPA